jgi:hypothetical protein
MTCVWRDDSPFCPHSRISSLLSAASWLPSCLFFAASCPPSWIGVHFLRHSCVELGLASTMQHSRRPVARKQRFVSFGISLLISNTVPVYTLPLVKGSKMTAPRTADPEDGRSLTCSSTWRQKRVSPQKPGPELRLRAARSSICPVMSSMILASRHKWE